MKKNLSWVVSAAMFSLNAPVLALTPWSFAPLTPTTINVPSNATATIRYTVTNNSVQHTLMMLPITGISQTTTGNGICTNPFTLPPRASCTLSLQVNGSALTQTINSGPAVCQQGVDGQPNLQECYQPETQAASLNISSAAALAVGDRFGGGTVACLGGAPYLNLIAATTDNSAGIYWGPVTILVPNADSLTDGDTNTPSIVDCLTGGIGAAECFGGTLTITSYAAGICSNYTNDGYTDWFLPSLNQLGCLNTNKTAINLEPNGYWSSTQADQDGAYYWNIPSNLSDSVLKNITNLHVRCVRNLAL